MVIITNKSGRLGNRILLYAHFIAWACYTGSTIKNPSFDEYADYFASMYGQSTFRFPDSRKPRTETGWITRMIRRFIFWWYFGLTRIVQITGVRNFLWYSIIDVEWSTSVTLSDPDFSNRLIKKAVTLVRGFKYKDRDNLKKYAGLIRDYFKPASQYWHNITAFMDKMRESADIVIGVHLRREDYRNWKDGKYFFSVQQFVTIIQQAEALFKKKRVHFVLCSNEKIDTDDFKDFRLSMGPGSVIEDMYTLSQCDYLIGPPSTFSLWASFYGDVPIYVIEDPERVISLKSFTSCFKSAHF